MYSLGVKRNEMYTLRVKRYAQTLPRIWIVKFIPRFIPVFLKRAKRYDKDTLRVERYVFKLRGRIGTSTHTSRAKRSLSLKDVISKKGLATSLHKSNLANNDIHITCSWLIIYVWFEKLMNCVWSCDFFWCMFLWNGQINMRLWL